MTLRTAILAAILALPAPAADAGTAYVIDPTLAYYTGRSAESIVDELKANGCNEVYLSWIESTKESLELAKALKAGEIKVWMLVDLTAAPSQPPAERASWLMKRTKQTEGQAQSYCPINAGYRAWRKKQIVTDLANGPFLGVVLAASGFPGEKGPAGDDYGCVCDSCAAAFVKMNPGVPGPPDFSDAASPRYYKTDTTLYDKWVGFRVSAIVGFLDELVSGEDGIRRKCPQAQIATWSIGLNDPDGPRLVRERFGLDAPAIVKRIKPDRHIVASAFTDWSNPDLPERYVKAYKPVLDSVREASPETPVFVLADIGSKENTRRTRSWMRDVDKLATETGFKGPVFRDYSLGDYIYTEPPSVVSATYQQDTIKLSFNKRLDSASAANLGNYSVTSGQIDYAKVDGSVVTLSASGITGAVTVTVSGISDDEAARRFHDKPACAMTQSMPLTVEPKPAE